jgi:hypothetical protein
VLKRENLTFDPMLIDGVVQVNPNRPLRNELTSVLGVGYVRSADCLHLAVALYLSADPTAFTFLTLDARQQAVAAALGFAT